MPILPRLPFTRDETPVTLYNPLASDFSVSYAIDDAKPKIYTIHSKEAATFPKFLADHIAKHLTQKIVLSRKIKTNYKDEYDNVLQNEVLVNI